MKHRSDARYPDISDLLALKAEGRRARAARSFSEKIDVLEALRARVEPLRRARLERQKNRPQSPKD